MAKLFFKLLLLLAIVAVGNNIVFRLLNLPFSWGNSVSNTKSQYLLTHKNKFNSIFVGSSRTMYQVDVAAFDSLTNHNTQSFNFGIDYGICAPEIFYYVKNLVKNDSFIKNVFIEVSDVEYVPATRVSEWNHFHLDNFHYQEMKYWYNFEAWIFDVKAILSSNFNWPTKVSIVINNTITFIEWLLKFDLFKAAIKAKNTPPDAIYLGDNLNGFIPEEETKYNVELRKESHQHLISDTSINNSLRNASIDFFKGDIGNLKVNTPYYNKFREVVSGLQNKGIRVFLILPPRNLKLHYSNIVPAFIKLDVGTKINMADANLNPEFYDMQYAYDWSHLNKAGAAIYTEKIAKSFNQTISKQ